MPRSGYERLPPWEPKWRRYRRSNDENTRGDHRSSGSASRNRLPRGLLHEPDDSRFLSSDPRRHRHGRRAGPGPPRPRSRSDLQAHRRSPNYARACRRPRPILVRDGAGPLQGRDHRTRPDGGRAIHPTATDFHHCRGGSEADPAGDLDQIEPTPAWRAARLTRPHPCCPTARGDRRTGTEGEGFRAR
jgi:hypothetical protein